MKQKRGIRQSYTDQTEHQRNFSNPPKRISKMSEEEAEVFYENRRHYILKQLNKFKRRFNNHDNGHADELNNSFLDRIQMQKKQNFVIKKSLPKKRARRSIRSHSEQNRPKNHKRAAGEAKMIYKTKLIRKHRNSMKKTNKLRYSKKISSLKLIE